MPYYKQLRAYLSERQAMGAKITPSGDDIFRAFRETDFNKIKVVILGQDPYPNPGNANGLAFGVDDSVDAPRSLVNIFDEVERSLVAEARGDKFAETGNHHYTRHIGEKVLSDVELAECSIDRTKKTLVGWARQGVLLLNTVLTTEERRIGAHIGKGWEQFTDAVIKVLADKVRPATVFVLWGRDAFAKIPLINKWATGLDVPCSQDKHPIFVATHPGPLSYNRGPSVLRFQGCYHFARINSKLRSLGNDPIDWKQTK
jgi:uracil-DNA glycosylase